MRQSGAPRVLAVASGGGHWVQLLRVVPALAGAAEIVFVTVSERYGEEVPGHRLHVVNDATRWSPRACLRLAASMLAVLWRERPDVVLTTGAAPGCLAVLFGHYLGARTIWIDSLANVDAVSMSGRLVRRHAGLWLTQWAHLAAPDGPEHCGAVL